MMSKEDKVVWKPSDGITLHDIEMNRHFQEVQNMVYERLDKESIDPTNPKHQVKYGQRILDIWKEVVAEWKRFI